MFTIEVGAWTVFLLGALAGVVGFILMIVLSAAWSQRGGKR